MKKKKRGKAKRFNIHIHLTNRWLYTFIALGILMIIGVGVYALVTTTGGGHPSSEIIVSFGTCKVTLQNAVSNGYLKGTATPTGCLLESQFPKAYHTADKILITINSYTMTLQEAVNNNFFKSALPSRSYTTQLPAGGHLAGEVEVIVDGVKKSLQDAVSQLKCVTNFGQSCPSTVDPECINPGTIQCDGTCSGSYKSGTACSTSEGIPGVCNVNTGNCDATGVCIPGGTTTKYCDDLDTTCRNYNAVTDICKSDGTWTNPPCDSYTNAAKGTTPCDGSNVKACDDAGNCLGWSGTGCGSCPWGKSDKLYKGTGIDVTYNVCILNGNQGRSSAGLLGSSLTSPPWSYSEGSAAKCWQRQCCKMFLFICRKHCSSDFNWQIKP